MAEHEIRTDAPIVLPVHHRPYQSRRSMAPGIATLAVLSLAGETTLQGLAFLYIRVQAIELFSTLANITLIVLSLFLFLRLARNLSALGIDKPAWGTVWAWFGWLLPIVWWIIPYLVVRELWKTSDPDHIEPGAWRDVAIPTWFPLWWGLWVVSGILSWTFILWSLVHDIDPADIASIPLELNLLGAASLLLSLGALPFYIRLVAELPHRQDQRRERVSEASRAKGTF